VGHRIAISSLDRRTLLTRAAATVILTPFMAKAGEAPSPPSERSEEFKEVFAKLVGNAVPLEGKISVDLPETADNGNFVPITIAIDSPMTDADHVRAIHLLSTANPHAHVATFHLFPLNAVARVQSRMRLAKTQDVIVLAETSRGDMLISTTSVKVLIGGCGI
jgi:sulfur-oxidizing protein SoxY